MAFPWSAKIAAARVRRRFGRGTQPDREDVVRRLAPGKSFLDAGCMWNVHGRIAFEAEEAGATAVTGLDVAAPTPEYEDEHARRRSAVRFVQGDIHDGRTAARAGVHDLVFCSGVLYHSPNPVLLLERLRALTSETLVLQTMVVPELPGARNGLVFLPGLDEGQRRLYTRWGEVAARGLRSPRCEADPFAPWWWAISPSALRSMLRTAGFEPEQEWGDPFSLHVRARAV